MNDVTTAVPVCRTSASGPEEAAHTKQVAQRIREFVAETFLFRSGTANLSETDSLMGSGFMDSFGVLSLVVFLEDSFGFKVADAEVVPENLDSIVGLIDFVNRKISAAESEG